MVSLERKKVNSISGSHFLFIHLMTPIKTLLNYKRMLSGNMLNFLFVQ
jgi:hypothetical protein